MPASIEDFNIIIDSLSEQFDVSKDQTYNSSKALRYIIPKGRFFYHVLEKPKGIYPIYCRISTGHKKIINFNFNVYTIMILKFAYSNNKYTMVANRVVHSNEPVKKNLSNRLYEWKLSNVHTEGSICWGDTRNNALPEVDEDTSYKLLDEFFLSSKNNDLFSPKRWEDFDENTLYTINPRDCTQITGTLSEFIESI